MGKWLNSAARRQTMAKLIAAQGSRCYYCQKIMRCDVRARHPDRATIEHRVPRAAGGSSRSINLVAACRDCNNRKGALSEADFRSSLSTCAGGPEAAAIQPNDTPDDELEWWREVLLRLPEPSLAIFLMSRVEGLSYAQIADHLNVPQWVVRRHMLKCIRHIGDACRPEKSNYRWPSTVKISATR